jgi:mannose-6-phosphate isomerase-like protein (cupin superfamily)
MNRDCLEISSYNGEGYKPLVDFADWRVALLRFLDDLIPERIDSMERHMETDEVFVLLEGRGVLLLGGNGAEVSAFEAQPMEPVKLYTVKQYAWHSILMSRDANILLVENKDTGEHNTEFCPLKIEQQRAVQAIAKEYRFA